MENVHKQRSIDLVNTQKCAESLVSTPAFKKFKIFTENLVAVERLKTNIKLNRPLYVGFAILELSKTLMYKFHYNIIWERYKERTRLLFTDTNSLMFYTYTEDVYQDMTNLAYILDTSDYPDTHFLHSTQHKKKIGYSKDEINGDLILEFVGFRPKMYSFITEKSERKTAKGVSRCVVEHSIAHRDY